MNVDDVISKINSEIDCGEFKLTAVVKRNIEAIEQLNIEGYSYKVIAQKLNNNISYSHFRNLVSLARKKTALKLTPEPVREERKPLADAANSAPKEEKKTNQTDRTDWITIGVTMPILIAKLEKAGFTPDDVSSWGLPNEIQISNRLTEYMMKKS